MVQLFVHHKVHDFDHWRTVFDSMDSLRQRYGSTGARVFRNASDPSEVIILTEWPSFDHAQQYAQSDDLRQGMQQAGVMSPPEVLFLEEV